VPTTTVRRGDRIFRGLTLGSGLLIFGIIVAIAAFLVWKAIPAFRVAGFHFFSEKTWFPDATPAKFGVAALAFGTVLSSVLALVMVIPVGVGTALALTELASRRVGTIGGYAVDVLAAVPSVVYGLWGVYYLVPRLIPMQRWLDHHAGFIPLFQSRNNTFGRSVFAASAVLAIMVLPIVAAISREVFRQVPQANREAASTEMGRPVIAVGKARAPRVWKRTAPAAAPRNPPVAGPTRSAPPSARCWTACSRAPRSVRLRRCARACAISSREPVRTN